jgi:two-component system, OmpR family, alkaline phosphatase synthesis response regulator PhoP
MPRLLICDDEVHILRAAEFKLKRAGYEVRTASDGEEAWEAIRAQMPDMLITDYQMPRLDGLQLIARCRQTPSLATLPILLLTAKGMELDQPGLIAKFKLGAIFSKPFSPRELQSRVEQMVGKPLAQAVPETAMKGEPS